jgi:hypothetical protein
VIEQLSHEERCIACGTKILTHHALRRGDEVRYGGVELAGWLQSAGKRTYRPRASDRTGQRMVITAPGPITVHCRCGVGTAHKTVVGLGTMM